MVDKFEIARILDECGTLLELKGENPFRTRAYHNAARAIEQYEGDFAEAITKNQLTTIRGIGDTLRDKIQEIADTGKLTFHEKLVAEMPAGIGELLRIGSLGPKKIKVLHDQLGIKSVADLKAACERGEVAKLKGFGDKTQGKLLEGIAFLDKAGQRFLLPEAEALGVSLLERIKAVPGVKRAELCGSLRRRRETIADIDLLVSAKNPDPVMDAFAQANIRQVLGRGPTKSSVLLHNGMQADLRVVPDESFAFALNYFTGNKDHNIAMRQRAIDRGLRLNEYALEGKGKQLKAKEEADLYKHLDLAYIPPELRENTGEIAAAAEGRLPKLITVEDLVGTFHCHTTYSDGANSLEEMARAAKELGLKYLGIGDHSQSLTIARGLTPERVKQQHAEIDAVNARLKGIRLLKGTECDILADGQLDFDDELLATFEYVVASVHSHFKQSREEMTARIVRAIRNPYVSILGHATGRLLLRRDSYAVDVDRLLEAAAETRTVLEINAHPNRLDLDWLNVKKAKALGIKLAINPDAHRVAELPLLKYGIDVARRGWLTKDDVVNTRPWLEARLFIKQGRFVQ